MPNLHGQPRKDTLRKEIRQLRRDLWNLQLEHQKTRRSLQYSQSKVEELEAKLERTKTAAASIVSDIDQDVSPAVFERFKKRHFGW